MKQRIFYLLAMCLVNARACVPTMQYNVRGKVRSKAETHDSLQPYGMELKRFLPSMTLL